MNQHGNGFVRVSGLGADSARCPSTIKSLPDEVWVMSYTKAEYDEVEPKAPGMYFLREALDCEQLGMTVLEASEGWKGLEHDHSGDGQEEVYLLVDGSGQITIDGETVELTPGEAVRVSADATRELAFDAESLMVIAGAA